MNKYELTDETKVFYGVTLHRIRALTAVGVLAAAGQLGGWVESEKNLEQSGDAWVYGNAQVSGDAWVSKTRHYLTVGPIGSEDRTVTICRTKTYGTTGHYINAGCWTGTVDQLAERVASAWPDLSEKKRTRYRAEYEAVIALARPRIERWVK